MGVVLRRRHENREVQDPVLLGADEFFAVHQQDRPIALHHDLQLGHLAGVAHFGDLGPAARERLVQGEVLHLALGGAQQRHDRQILERGHGTERDVLHGVRKGLRAGDVWIHAVLLPGESPAEFRIRPRYDRTGQPSLADIRR